jgi:hypothetical protein
MENIARIGGTTLGAELASQIRLFEVKLPLSLTKHHAMKTYWRAEIQLHAFLPSALDGGDWSALRPGRFTASERAPGTHWIGGWVGPRAVVDTVVKRRIPSPRRESNPRTPIVQPVGQRYTDWAITVLGYLVRKLFYWSVTQDEGQPSVFLLLSKTVIMIVAQSSVSFLWNDFLFTVGLFNDASLTAFIILHTLSALRRN